MARSIQNPLFAPGQRWLSETEPELGMGTLVSFDNRLITLDFPDAECTRQYSRAAAPIKRVQFKPGDRIRTCDAREIVVEEIAEENGLFTYKSHGDTRICETDLAASLSFDLPFDRLVNGLAGSPKLFDLRHEIRSAQADYQASPARGFLGGQVDLIPHQLYIADQVCRRVFPRVLLSDETGLGKTIEAGLILHRLLVTGRIRRVLIILPQSLVHQWFIELLRKFSLSFRLFDREYVREAMAAEPGMNPFILDQQGIVSRDFLMSEKAAREWMLEGDFDMVVMDEAHHMTEDPEFHGFMKALAARTPGVMLLTATPEQMGIETHFAQLQLLDPLRYHDLAAYVKEAEGYETAASEARKLLDRGEPVEEILDAFGPGRVVFRNRRKAIKGFPDRRVTLSPLAADPAALCRAEPAKDDPRLVHLAQLCRAVKPEKILVICRSKETAQDIAAGIQTHMAVDTARFDETMDLLSRDRQAAWFAEPDGARLLVCSEIGSEGRNFQFVRHLYLFDLPENPELLEQRIGRVDRIGQKHEIIIHVPYIEGSSQEILALWYDRGVGLFKENVNGLHGIFTRFEPRLRGLMEKASEGGGIDRIALTELIRDTAEFVQTLQTSLDQGRHILLELNSFRPKAANELIKRIQETEQARELFSLMERLLDHFGVEMDLVGKDSQVVSMIPDRLVDENFPSLPRRARFTTFDRACAIARDDLDFLTWDHPFVHQVMEYFAIQGQGAAAAALLEGASSPGLVLETLYVLELPESDQFTRAARFLSPAPIHILMDHSGNRLEPSDLSLNFPSCLKPDRPGWFLDLAEVTGNLLPQLLDKSQTAAQKEAAKMRSQGLARMETVLKTETDRLIRLAQVNPGVSREEIEAAASEPAAISAMISGAKLRLDAVRLIRLSPGS